MKFPLNLLAFLFIGLWSLIGTSLQAAPSLVGVFTGNLHLIDGKPRDVAFQLSMNLSEETEIVETVNGPEQRRVIDASFIVDGEGGPYTFAKVSYDLDLNVLDLRYSRTRTDDSPNARAPATFRLTGKINDDGSLEGRVISGFYGNIGTFKLQRSEITFLQQTSKYRGFWTAKPVWFNETFKIYLESTLTNMQNPPGLELGFTPGKVGSLDIGAGAQLSFSNTSIDYLRQKLVVASVEATGPVISLDCDIVPVSIDLDCQFSSVYGGYKGPVYFTKVK